MIAKNTGLVLGGEVLYLVWAGGGCMFRSIGGLVGSSPWRVFIWFVFLLRLFKSKLGPQVMQASALFPIFPQRLQIVFCLTWGDLMYVWRVYVSLLVGDEAPKLLEHWPEDVKLVGDKIMYI